MHGFPKVINTRQDIDHLLQFLDSEWATPEDIDRAMSYLQSLKDGTQSYQFDRVLEDGEEPDGDYPDYLVLTDEEGTRRQQAMAHDRHDALYRLELTETEVNQILNTLESR